MKTNFQKCKYNKFKNNERYVTAFYFFAEQVSHLLALLSKNHYGSHFI